MYFMDRRTFRTINIMFSSIILLCHYFLLVVHYYGTSGKLLAIWTFQLSKNIVFRLPNNLCLQKYLKAKCLCFSSDIANFLKQNVCVFLYFWSKHSILTHSVSRFCEGHGRACCGFPCFQKHWYCKFLKAKSLPFSFFLVKVQNIDTKRKKEKRKKVLYFYQYIYILSYGSQLDSVLYFY